MNDRPDLELVVTRRLQDDAPSRAPERVLPAALDRAARISQARPLGGRRLAGWIDDSPWLRTRVVTLLVVLAILALLGAAVAFIGSQRQAEPPLTVSNGWIAYSTDGQLPGSTDTATGSDIYLVREGARPTLIAGRDTGLTRNVCPAFSPDGRMLAYGVDAAQGRAVVLLGVDPNGVITGTVRILVPGSGSTVCPIWSADGRRVAYLDRGTVVVRGLDGSTLTSVAGDPGVEDFGRGRGFADAHLSPAGDRTVRIESPDSGCDLVVARPDGTAAHVIALGTVCAYAIAAWSPDGRQVLSMQDVSGSSFTMHAVAVDSPFDMTTIVSDVITNGARSWPGWGDVSWQPVFR